MGNKAKRDYNAYFWSIEERYRHFLLAKLKAHLADAGHQGVAFFYILTSSRLLFKTYQKTPRLQEIINRFEGHFTFEKKSAVARTVQDATALKFEGLVELAKLTVDTQLESVNQNDYNYWIDLLRSLESTESVEHRKYKDLQITKFLIRYYTLKNILIRLEPHFTLEKVKQQALHSTATEQQEREWEAVESIGRRKFPELFSNEADDKGLKSTKPESKEHKINTMNLIFEKLDWQGTQKELAELFIELKRKGWIKEIVEETIQACFTNSNTFSQVIKANRDESYPAVYTVTYMPKFDTIKPKPAKAKRKRK